MGKKQREKKERKLAEMEIRRNELKSHSTDIEILKIFKSVAFYIYLICFLAIAAYPFIYQKYIPHGKYAVLNTSMGEIKIELYRDKAPKTVDNFVDLAKNDFYKNMIWHRVVKNFVIQTGDPTGTGTGGAGRQIDDEISDLAFIEGTVGMANAGENTNDSQFFITTTDVQETLNGKYTSFARVIEGMDIVKKISEVEVGEDEKPLADVLLNDVKIK